MITISEDFNDEEKLEQLLEEISFFRKKSFTGVSNLKTDVRKTLLADFPFMAKL